jgi:hypothetical protein
MVAEHLNIMSLAGDPSNHFSLPLNPTTMMISMHMHLGLSSDTECSCYPNYFFSLVVLQACGAFFSES